jgi:hypothetical protein
VCCSAGPSRFKSRLDVTGFICINDNWGHRLFGAQTRSQLAMPTLYAGISEARRVALQGYLPTTSRLGGPRLRCYRTPDQTVTNLALAARCMCLLSAPSDALMCHRRWTRITAIQSRVFVMYRNFLCDSDYASHKYISYGTVLEGFAGVPYCCQKQSFFPLQPIPTGRVFLKCRALH